MTGSAVGLPLTLVTPRLPVCGVVVQSDSVTDLQVEERYLPLRPTVQSYRNEGEVCKVADASLHQLCSSGETDTPRLPLSPLSPYTPC